MIKNEELEVAAEEHITIARDQDYNGDLQSVYSSEGGQQKLSKYNETENIKASVDVPLLSEHEKRELVSLVKDKNISMDFILEMKEAFLLFDKVRNII